MREIGIQLSISWLNHSPWTEKYVGLRKLSIEKIPDKIHQMEAEHSTICHSIIIGSNQLIEMAFFQIIKNHIGIEITQKDYDSSFYQGIKTLPQKITKKPINLQEEPFLSMDKLRKRRNETVHKKAAVADVIMARSALYTAVETVKAIYLHFNQKFPYGIFLDNYPLDENILFSKVVYPENFLKHNSKSI